MRQSDGSGMYEPTEDGAQIVRSVEPVLPSASEKVKSAP